MKNNNILVAIGFVFVWCFSHYDGWKIRLKYIRLKGFLIIKIVKFDNSPLDYWSGFG